jgi:hypothetical protein
MAELVEHWPATYYVVGSMNFDPCRRLPRGVAVDIGPKTVWLVNKSAGQPQYFCNIHQLVIHDTSWRS